MNLWDAVRRALWGQGARVYRLTSAEQPGGPRGVPASAHGADAVTVDGPAPAPAPVDAASVDDAVAARQERAAERLLEDERLRQSMTDEEFEPLLKWALATLDRVAAETAGHPDAAADEQLERALVSIREVFGAADRVLVLHAEGRDRELRDELGLLAAAIAPPLVPPDDAAGGRARITAALERLAPGQRRFPEGVDEGGGRAALAQRLAESLAETLRPRGGVVP